MANMKSAVEILEAKIKSVTPSALQQYQIAEAMEEYANQYKTKSIAIGEIFEVDGKKYVCGVPKNAGGEVNEHGHIMCTLTEL